MKSPHGGFNRMVVSVTLCRPGTKFCATIDDVMVDTGSIGLRVEASAMPSALRLPAFLGPNGAPLAECLRFVHDAAWGPLVRADLRLGTLGAPDIPLQLIEDDPKGQPQKCPPSHVHPTSNGTLGVGPRLYDCQGLCEQNEAAPGVFTRELGAWFPFKGRVARQYRLPNPVSRLPVHNNGVVIDLPSPREGGETEVSGTLTFGVGTAGNNQLGNARILPLDRRGYFTTLYDGIEYSESYLDSGTMTYVFRGGGLSRCSYTSWAFCLKPAQKLAATTFGPYGAAIPTSFAVGDYQAIGEHRLGAVDSAAIAAEDGSKTFVWGAPYFLGKRVYLVIEGMIVPSKANTAGPFFAFP